MRSNTARQATRPSRAADSAGSVRPTFAHGLPSSMHDVGREVVVAAQQRRADAVGVDRHAEALEVADLLGREAARADDLHALVAGGVERLAHLARPARGSRRSAGSRPSRPTATRSTRRSEVSSRTPQRSSPSASATSIAVVTESFSKSTSTVTFISCAYWLRPRLRGRDRVAAVGRDQRVRHGADAAAAPPRRLRVGRHADRARHVRGPAVARLHEPVVVARREEQDLLAARRPRPPRGRCASRASGAPCSPGRRSRGGRTAGSRPRSSSRSRTARSRRPRSSACTSSASQSSAHSFRTAIASSIPPSTECFFWKTCITTRACLSSRLEQLLREVEVGVRVVARPDAVDGQAEDVRREALARHRRQARAKDSAPRADVRCRGMRATRAYIASAGTAAVMLGASLCMFVLVSAFVAFGSWPGTSRTPRSTRWS